MFSRQKLQVDEARHRLDMARHRLRTDQQTLQRGKSDFLSRPANLMYPFAAGALVCASQLQNKPHGFRRIPFLSLAKSMVTAYALVSRVQRLRKSPERGARHDELVDASEAMTH